MTKNRSPPGRETRLMKLDGNGFLDLLPFTKEPIERVGWMNFIYLSH